MTIVVDASIAAKWFIEEPDTRAALDIRSEPVIAPDLIVAEIANVLWKNVRLKRIAAEHCLSVMRLLPRYFRDIYPILPLAPRAAEIATTLDHPVYDAFYIALAEREGCALMTADNRLLRAVKGTRFAKRVRPLKDP